MKKIWIKLTPFRNMFTGKLCLIAIFLSLWQIASAQNGIISGSVTSSEGEPLIGVAVFIEGTSIGTTTDENGQFVLSAGQGQTLTVSSLGYKTKQIEIGSQTTIDISLEDDINLMDEVVVVGYGTQKRKDLVGAVEQVKGGDLKTNSYSGAVRSLQGQIPGLTLEFADGKPNHGATLNIRGASQSIGSGGSSLVLVDGVESSLDNVIPEDIETITVLKDASSCAIYGARGAFGVILVTTKNPTSGKVKVSYNGSVSLLSNTVDYDFVTDPVYWTQATLDHYEGCYGVPPTGFNNLFPYSDSWFQELKRRYLDPSYENYHVPVGVGEDGRYQYYGQTDWFDLMYKDVTYNHQHSLNISGGTDKIQFYLSGRYFDQKGIYNTEFDHYWKANAHAKITAKITKWWTMSNDLVFYRSYYKQPVLFQIEQSVKGQIEHQAFPVTIPYNPDGSFTDAAVCVGYSAFKTGLSYQLNEDFKLGETLTNTFHILPGVLEFTTSFSYAFNSSKRDRKTNIYAFKNGPDLPSSRPAWDSYEELWQRHEYIKEDGFFTYTPKLGEKHSLKVTAGYNIENSKDIGTVALERNLFREDKPNFDLTKADVYYIDDYGSKSWSFVGFFGRINYNFNDKYLIEVSGRYDGSSKFPVNSRWGFFPSASLGWRLSGEKFMDWSKSWLDNLKIRLSAGSLGNGAVSPYAYQQSMAINTSSIYIDGEQVPITNAPTPIPNELTWERATTYDVGLDIDLFNYRLSIVGDYYLRKTTDMFTIGKTLPAVYGNDAPKGNYADMSTRGWELSIGWRDSFKAGGRDFSYGIKAMVWDSRSFIDRYNNETRSLTDYYEGMELGEIWGLHVVGLFADENDVATSADQSTFFTQNRRGNRFEPGDLKFEDVNGDKFINYGKNTADDPGDMKIIGNTNPRYSYGINLNASWNGIGLSLFFQGVGQRDWYPGINTGMFYGKYARPYSMIPTSQIGNQWTEENPDPNAFWPKAASYLCTDTKGTLSKVANDRFLVDASYCRLKNITIDYTFPKKLIRRIGLENLRIYLSGDNLFTFTPMRKWTTAFDPEVIQAGDSDLNGVYNANSKVDGTSYPMLKSMTLGINLTF